MDTNILAIILGLITNGLTALGAQVGRQSGKLLIGEEFLKKWELEKTALQPALHSAIKEVAESIQWKGPAREEIVCLFLLSPEVEEIVRQIYSTTILNKKSKSGLKPIRQIFLASFSLFLSSYPDGIDLDDKKLVAPANILIDILIRECELALANAIDKGTISAHEAQSAFRHHILLDEVAAIHKKLDTLTAYRRTDFQNILTFEKRYRQQISNRHKDIIPPYLDTLQRIAIERIFVSPRLVTIPKKEEKPVVLDMARFFSVSYRSVVLGNPGAGKSTLTHKLCYELSTHSAERIFANRNQVTPILVVLREYGAEKKARGCSILQFIEMKANANYQLQPPSGAFDYLLLNGRAIVIFDGLDELIETNYRQEISRDVESFCNLYPSVPVLVTSREVGYEQAPLDEEKFQVFRLHPFNDAQVEDYVKKWFSIAYKDLSREHREQKAKAFLNESKSVPDLRSNPLMLALICNIYRGENYIPRNRPDVYEKCALMLFERWDKSRGIYVNLPFDWHIKPLIEHLAYWIYVDEKLRGGVTEEELVTKAKEYLDEWLFDDYNKSEKAAWEFIGFCTGRAWVFTDTGTKKEGEKLFQFTHTTFLEYFAASHLVRTHRTPDMLMQDLKSKIAKREWEVVAQLAFQLQNKKIAGAGDELLLALIEQEPDLDTIAQLNLLSFATRCLEFIIPRPKVTRRIIKAYIKHCLKVGEEIIKKHQSFREISKNYPNYGSQDSSFRPGAIISKLLYMSQNENAPTIRESFDNELASVVSGGSELEAIIALDIGQFRINDIRQISADCATRIESLYPEHFWLCNKAVREGNCSLVDFISWYGIAGIFRGYMYPLGMGDAMGAGSLGELYARRLIDGPYSHWALKWLISILDNIKIMEHTLITYSPPWIQLPDEHIKPSDWWLREDDIKVDKPLKLVKLDSEDLFGAFVLISVLLEIEESSKRDIKQKIDIIQASQAILFDHIRLVLCSRYDQEKIDKVQEEMDRCGFTKEQQGFVWRWIRREINLVEQGVIEE